MTDSTKIENSLYSKILDFVSYSFRTEKEIRDKLSSYLKKVSLESQSEKEEIYEKIMSDLTDSGYVNDEEYVKRYVEGLILSKKNKSVREASAFLYKKGISGNLSDKYLSSVGDVLEGKSLRNLVEKKLRTIKNPGDPLSKRKLIKYLVSKGYSFEKARDEVDSAVSLK